MGSVRLTNMIPVYGQSPTNGSATPISIPLAFVSSICAPDASQCNLMAPLITTPPSSRDATCAVRSSACWWVIGARDPSESVIPWSTPVSPKRRRYAASGCAAMVYSKGERGLPCATPE